jgi:rhodanese-related sulfurtransferase
MEFSMTVPTIHAREVFRLQQSGQPLELIDVRTPVEYREMHAVGARLTPLDRLDPEALERERTPGCTLYVLCRSGGRARQACEKLLAAGHRDVVCIEGGTLAWEKEGLPVERGRKAMSLERQVRIAAGSLVLLGAVLGWLVHPLGMGLSAFVGAGLVFAGVTDTCGMGLLLARMPWNQVREDKPTCAVG